MSSTKYVYGFVPWPDGSFTGSDAMKRLLRLIKHRYEEIMTAKEFGEFRIGLQVDGIELCEIERVPYHTPETVI